MLLLVICSWTQLSAQTGKTCYTSEELQKIADKMVKAGELDTLYKVAQLQLVHKDSSIFALNHAFLAQKQALKENRVIINLKEEIITGKDFEIEELRESLKSTNRRLKWTKVKWAGTTIGLSGALIYLILK